MKLPAVLRSLSLLLSLALGLSALFPFPLSAQQGAGDPTRTDAEMEEVLRALRASEEDDAASQSANAIGRVSLAGLVVASSGQAGIAEGSALLRVGNLFVLARKGQTVTNGSKSYLVQSASESLVLLEESGGEQLVLRAQNARDAQGGEQDLALVEFQEVPLHLAARALSDETGLRIVVSSQARQTPISLYLRGVDIADALDSLVLTHRLYQSDIPEADIVRLHTTAEYAEDASAFRDERTRVFTLKYPNARDVALSIRDLYGDRVQLAQRFEDEDEPGEYLSEDLQQRLERFDIIDARGQGFGVDSGGNQGGRGLQALSNRFNNRNNNNNNFLNSANRLFGDDQALSQDDRFTEADDELSPEQIAALASGDPRVIEQILQQRADIFVTVIDRLNKVMVRTRDDKTMQEIGDLVQSLDVPTPLVLLEVKIMEVDLARGLDTAFDWSFNSGEFAGSFAPVSPFNAGDLIFSYLDSTFQAQVRLLQQANKLTILGKPMLLTANNEVSRLFIGEEVPLNRNFDGGQTIVTDGTPIVAASNTDIEFRPVGSTLLITPNINADRTVSLRVLQEESRVVEGGADVLVPDQGGGFVSQTIDTVASQTASGTFVARDKQTIAVGGMITERLESRRSQIPILGDIPIVGRLARNQIVGRERREIVLLLTPHIIQTPGEGEAISQRVVQKNSLHPNAPTGEGTLGAFIEQEVLDTGSEEFIPLRRVQRLQQQLDSLRPSWNRPPENTATSEPKKAVQVFKKR
ncbi:MAG: hypothetical protein AAF555_07850 [Verrucomicrobiota bacterium]